MRLCGLLLVLVAGCLLLSAQDGFYRFAVQQDRLQGAVDFSYLNQELDSAKRIFVNGEHFFAVGADGQPQSADDVQVRFFGVNLAFGGNFPDTKDAARIAKRLRRLGVNLVRLHHMDTSPDEDVARARSILTTGPYPTFNPVAVERLKALLDAFRREGIYINLNLHVGYVFRPEVDKVPSLPDGAAMPTHSKPLHIFYPTMVEKQEEFARRLIRLLELKNNPVLAMAEINNESSLLWAWQRRLLGQHLKGDYLHVLEAKWNDYLVKKYAHTEALRAAWGDAATELTLGRTPVLPDATKEPAAMVNDWLGFLVETDREYLNRIRGVIREEAGPLVPVAGTQMGFGGPLTFDSHRDLDYIDEHFYVDHYNFPGRSWDSNNWRIRDSSSIGENWMRFFQAGAARQAGKPFTLSEYNQQWPNRQGHEIDAGLAVFASMQDWDGLMHFAYAHSQSWDTMTPSGFDLNADHAKLVNFGQSAMIFRERLLQPARHVVRLPFPLEWRLEAARAGKIREMPDFLGDKLGVNVYVLFRHQVRADPSADYLSFRLPREAGEATAIDTGELGYVPGRRISRIMAPSVAGVIGYLEHRPVTAGPVTVELAPSARGFATILLTSIDGKAIAESTRLLLTNPGYTLGSEPGSHPPVPQKLAHYPGTTDWWTLRPATGQPGPSGTRTGGVTPLWMERVECTVTLATSADSIEVFPLDGAGVRGEALPPARVRKGEDGFVIHLQADGDTLSPWYEIAVRRQN